MTMPHLSNCPHSEDSWCMDCVAEAWRDDYNDGLTAGIQVASQIADWMLGNEREAAIKQIASLRMRSMRFGVVPKGTFVHGELITSDAVPKDVCLTQTYI